MRRLLLIAPLALACGEPDPGRAQLQAEPPPGALTFDPVRVGETAPPRIVALTNLGAGPLEITATVEGAGFALSSAPTTVAPLATGEVFVRYQPEVPGPASGTLTITTNDPDAATLTYGLSGEARAACSFSVTPTALTFELGQTQEVRIIADSACTFRSIGTDAELFSLDAPPRPFDLGPGEEAVLTVMQIGTVAVPTVPTRELWIRANDGAERSVILTAAVPAQGCLSVSPTTVINFGSVPRGETQVENVELANSCDSAVLVRSAVAPHPFGVGALPSLPLVPSLGTLEVPVSFTGVDSVTNTGQVTIVTDDSPEPYIVELFGRSAKPRALVIPSNLSLGQAVFRAPPPPAARSTCGSASRVARLHNYGDHDLVVEGVAIEGADEQAFEILSVEIEGAAVSFRRPLRLEPGRSLEVTVRFIPTRTTPSMHVAELLLRHDADGSLSSVHLTGEALPDAVQVDTFTAPSAPTFDLLLVIDTSCSAVDIRPNLESFAGDLVRDADIAGASYQMAATTVDSESPAAGMLNSCVGRPSVVRTPDGDTESRAADLSCLIWGGPVIDTVESGLGAAWRTLDTNRTTLTRSDVPMEIVIISDEDDQSQVAQQVLLEGLIAAKQPGRPDLLRVSAIAGPTMAAGCMSAAPGFRYQWMAQQTGGVFLDICQDLTAYGPALDLLRERSRRLWSLSVPPDPATFAVTVDGVTVPLDPTDGASLEPGDVLRFNGTSEPDPGASIVATYSPLCDN